MKLCKLIPREILESIYGINIPEPGEGQDPDRPPTADEFLSAYSRVRGFMTSHGVPDCSRGARYIIKDFLSVCLQAIHLCSLGVVPYCSRI